MRRAFPQLGRARDLGTSLHVSFPPCSHPGEAMNAAGLSSTTPDTRLHALLERGLAQARARDAAAASVEAATEAVAGPRSKPPLTPRSLGLASDRACVESNLARKGLWRSGTRARGGELVRLLDATDQLGMVQRIDAGPPLGALTFDVIVWACSRWRELGEAGERHVAFTLEAMAADLGWRKGGGAAAELARALDTLRSATSERGSTTPAWPRRGSTPSASSTAGSAASPTARGAPPGPAFSCWATGCTSSSRAGTSPTARRLLVYLEAERFAGRRWRRTIDVPLLTTLGISAVKPFHQRATLRRAAEELTRAPNRYELVVEHAEERGGYRLVATRPDAARERPAQSAR